MSFIKNIAATEKDLNKIILTVFAFIFSGYVTARSLIPGVGFTLISIIWLLYSSPFYFHKKIISITSKNFFVLLFPALFLQMLYLSQ